MFRFCLDNVLFLLSLYVWLQNIRKKFRVCLCVMLYTFVCNCIIVIMSFWFGRANARDTHRRYDIDQRIPHMNCEMDELWTGKKRTKKYFESIQSVRQKLKIIPHMWSLPCVCVRVSAQKTSPKHVCFDLFNFSNIKLAPSQQLQLRAKSTFAHLLNITGV